MDVDLRVERDAESASRVCAEVLVSARHHLVLTGGTTPERAYELAAELRPDWNDVELWWGDERCVPPEHEWSNFGMAKRTLLDRLRTPPREVHRIHGELGAEPAARRYDEEAAGLVPDIALLGVGPDGHVASLYPQAPTLAERQRSAVAAEAQLEPFVERVTLTIPIFESAALLVFFVTGEARAEAVGRAFGEPAGNATPASLVRSRTGRTLAILDDAAATRLKA